MAIKVKKVTVTSAELLAINATPKEMLAAPAAGYVNNILAITHNLDFVSAAYAAFTVLYYYTFGIPSSTNQFAQDSNSLANVVDAEMPLIKRNSTLGTTATALMLSALGDPTTGDSDLIAYIVYETKLIEV